MKRYYRRKKIQNFCWKINNPASPVESKVKRQKMAVAESHLDLLTNHFHHSSSSNLKSRVSCSNCCLNTKVILLPCKAKRDNIIILQDTKK